MGEGHYRELGMVMGEFVLAVGVLLIGATLYLLVRPQALIVLIDQALTTRWLFLVALIRLLLGAALIASASAVGFSGVIAAIGWLGGFKRHGFSRSSSCRMGAI